VSRDIPEKPTFTFRNGITVTLERVGPLFALPIRKAFPPPDPPLAPGVGGELEPNPADPDYARALTAYHEELGFRVQVAMLDAGISDDLEIDAAQVARIRRIAKRNGASLDDEDDRQVFIKYCLIPALDDITRFTRALAAYGTVTEEDARAAAAMFPGDGGRGAAGAGPDAAAPVAAEV
jgi:hypothetical protein